MTVGGVSNCISYYVEGMEGESAMRTVRLTVTKSACRSGYCKQGDSFVVKALMSASMS